MLELLAQGLLLLLAGLLLFICAAAAWGMTRELVTYRPQGWLEWLVFGWQVLAGCLLVGAMFVVWLRGEAEAQARRVVTVSFYVLAAGILVHWRI